MPGDKVSVFDELMRPNCPRPLKPNPVLFVLLFDFRRRVKRDQEDSQDSE